MKSGFTDEKVKIRKIEAATRQLNTAIALWFNDGDLVATHTIACAAHQIITDLVKNRCAGETMYDSPVFKDEYRTEVNRNLRAAQNFFKHANEDPNPNAEHDFWTGFPEMMIMFSLRGLEQLGYKKEGPGYAFTAWFYLQHPEMIKGESKLALAPIISLGEKLFHQASKQQYYEMFLRAYSNLPTIT